MAYADVTLILVVINFCHGMVWLGIALWASNDALLKVARFFWLEGD